MDPMADSGNRQEYQYHYHYPMQKGEKRIRLRTQIILIALAVGVLGFFASRSVTETARSAMNRTSSASQNTEAAQGDSTQEAQEQKPLKAGEIDVFDGVEVIFAGTAPYGTAEISVNPNDYPLYLDKDSGLANGDTVTLKFVVDSDYSDEEIYEQYGGKPQTTEKTFTVAGLAKYIDSTEDLTAEVLAPLKSEEEKKIADDNSRITDLLTFGAPQYAGAVVQASREGADTSDHNILTLVYKIDAEIKADAGTDENGTGYEENGEAFSYYTWVSFYNAVLNADGSCTVESGERDYPGPDNIQVLHSGGTTYIYGYMDGDLLALRDYLIGNVNANWNFATDIPDMQQEI